ncbi:hypothetical protein [Nonomuraea sp. NPDC002799]
MDDVYRHYRRLLDTSWLGGAICWTVLVPDDGRAPDLADIGERVSGSGRFKVHETAAFERQEDFFGLAADAEWALLVDDAAAPVTLFEHNGFQCVYPPVLPRLSEDGRAYSVYWNVNGTNRIGFAAGGEMVLSFDGMDVRDAAGRPGWERWPQLGELLPYFDWRHGGSWRAAALTAIELATGARLSMEWLTRARSCLTG